MNEQMWKDEKREHEKNENVFIVTNTLPNQYTTAGTDPGGPGSPGARAPS